MAELIAPTRRLFGPWLVAHQEWGPGEHEDGFGLTPTDDVATPSGFESWLARLELQSDSQGAEDPTGPHCRYWWIVEGDTVLGGIALRYGTGPLIERAGHIGYGIRPSARRRGLATWALAHILPEARRLGLDRVLLVCAGDNLASAAMIERSGATLEGIRRRGDGSTRRYWLATS